LLRSFQHKRGSLPLSRRVGCWKEGGWTLKKSFDTVFASKEEVKMRFYLTLIALFAVSFTQLFAGNPAAADTAPTYQIGQYAQGGVVFWLTPDKKHGLVVAIGDIGVMAWGTAGTSVSAVNNDLSIGYNANGTLTSGGKLNSDYIINANVTASAASQCAAYTGGGYTNWYLPNLLELLAIYNQRSVINSVSIANGGSALANTNYWGSVQSITGAGNMDMSSGILSFFAESNTFHVRPVRVF
jgi:hypothetical protein